MEYTLCTSSEEEGQIPSTNFPSHITVLQYCYYPHTNIFIGDNNLPRLSDYQDNTMTTRIKKRVKREYFENVYKDKAFFDNKFRFVCEFNFDCNVDNINSIEDVNKSCKDNNNLDNICNLDNVNKNGEDNVNKSCKDNVNSMDNICNLDNVNNINSMDNNNVKNNLDINSIDNLNRNNMEILDIKNKEDKINNTKTKSKKNNKKVNRSLSTTKLNVSNTEQLISSTTEQLISSTTKQYLTSTPNTSTKQIPVLTKVIHSYKKIPLQSQLLSSHQSSDIYLDTFTNLIYHQNKSNLIIIKDSILSKIQNKNIFTHFKILKNKNIVFEDLYYKKMNSYEYMEMHYERMCSEYRSSELRWFKFGEYEIVVYSGTCFILDEVCGDKRFIDGGDYRGCSSRERYFNSECIDREICGDSKYCIDRECLYDGGNVDCICGSSNVNIGDGNINSVDIYNSINKCNIDNNINTNNNTNINNNTNNNINTNNNSTSNTNMNTNINNNTNNNHTSNTFTNTNINDNNILKRYYNNIDCNKNYLSITDKKHIKIIPVEFSNKVDLNFIKWVLKKELEIGDYAYNNGKLYKIEVDGESILYEGFDYELVN